jgi:hypothetical protein
VPAPPVTGIYPLGSAGLGSGLYEPIQPATNSEAIETTDLLSRQVTRAYGNSLALRFKLGTAEFPKLERGSVAFPPGVTQHLRKDWSSERPTGRITISRQRQILTGAIKQPTN